MRLCYAVAVGFTNAEDIIDITDLVQREVITQGDVGVDWAGGGGDWGGNECREIGELGGGYVDVWGIEIRATRSR